MLDHRVVLLSRKLLFFTVAAPIYLPTHSAQGFPFPHPHEHVLPFGFLRRATLVGVGDLTVVLISPIIVMWNTFSGTCWSLVCCLWKNVCTGPLPIFKLRCSEFLFFLWSYISSLYIWLLCPLSDKWLANIFSHSTG